MNAYLTPDPVHPAQDAAPREPQLVRFPAGVLRLTAATTRLRPFLLALLSGVLLLLILPGSVAAASLLTTSASGAATSDDLGSCTPGNVVAYAHSVVVAPEQVICGDANAFGGSVQVAGRVGGNVTAIGGSVYVLGEVDGNVTAIGGGVSLGPAARIAGDVQSWGGSVHRDHGAQVYGHIGAGDRVAEIVGGQWPGASYVYGFPWPWILGWGVVAAIIVTLFPQRTARVRMVAGSAAVRSVVVGLLTAVLGVSLAALLFATCIGIPLSLLVMAGLGAGWVLGTVAIGLWLGEHIVRTAEPRRRSTLLQAIVGAVLLAGVESLPCVGGVVAVVASSLGLGAALLSRFGGRRRGLSLSAPAKHVS